MILQALTRYYEDLIARKEISPPGWAPCGVSFVAYLGEDGQLEQIVSVRIEQTSGKKMVRRPQNMILPLTAEGRTSVAVRPNFLWDNAGYILGINSKGDLNRGQKMFAACKTLHRNLLKGRSSPAICALLNFFEQWDPKNATLHPVVQPCLEELKKGGNMVFRFRGTFLHEDPEARMAWDTYYNSDSDDSQMGICLVTGERRPIARLHPKIKGVINADAKGIPLVSFNADAFCSYGKEQGMNAPVGKYAAFAYTTALNHLLADRDRVIFLGDTTVVCWVEGGERSYQDILSALLSDRPSPYSERELLEKVRVLLTGENVLIDDERLELSKPFYILGLTPNKTRLIVRFFLRNSFGEFLQNVTAHYARMDIAAPRGCDYPPSLKPRVLLASAAGGTDIPPKIGSDLIHSILWDRPYPPALTSMVRTRIVRDGYVSYQRAAVLKADMIRRNKIKEGTMETHDDTFWPLPRTLGALFAVYEEIQYLANPNINATIHDRYFPQALDSPHVAFQRLNRLAEVQLRQGFRRDQMRAGRLCNEVKSLMSKIDLSTGDVPIPHSFTNDEKNLFVIGYYLRKNWIPTKQNNHYKEESADE